MATNPHFSGPVYQQSAGPRIYKDRPVVDWAKAITKGAESGARIGQMWAETYLKSVETSQQVKESESRIQTDAAKLGMEQERLKLAITAADGSNKLVEAQTEAARAETVLRNNQSRIAELELESKEEDLALGITYQDRMNRYQALEALSVVNLNRAVVTKGVASEPYIQLASRLGEVDKADNAIDVWYNLKEAEQFDRHEIVRGMRVAATTADVNSSRTERGVLNLSAGILSTSGAYKQLAGRLFRTGDDDSMETSKKVDISGSEDVLAAVSSGGKQDSTTNTVTVKSRANQPYPVVAAAIAAGDVKAIAANWYGASAEAREAFNQHAVEQFGVEKWGQIIVAGNLEGATANGLTARELRERGVGVTSTTPTGVASAASVPITTAGRMAADENQRQVDKLASPGSATYDALVAGDPLTPLVNKVRGIDATKKSKTVVESVAPDWTFAQYVAALDKKGEISEEQAQKSRAYWSDQQAAASAQDTPEKKAAFALASRKLKYLAETFTFSDTGTTTSATRASDTPAAVAARSSTTASSAGPTPEQIALSLASIKAAEAAGRPLTEAQARSKQWLQSNGKWQ